MFSRWCSYYVRCLDAVKVHNFFGTKKETSTRERERERERDKKAKAQFDTIDADIQQIKTIRPTNKVTKAKKKKKKKRRRKDKL